VWVWSLKIHLRCRRGLDKCAFGWWRRLWWLRSLLLWIALWSLNHLYRFVISTGSACCDFAVRSY
jgi:hypothetical protein